jgi:hypothetical protein
MGLHAKRGHFRARDAAFFGLVDGIVMVEVHVKILAGIRGAAFLIGQNKEDWRMPVRQSVRRRCQDYGGPNGDSGQGEQLAGSHGLHLQAYRRTRAAAGHVAVMRK